MSMADLKHTLKRRTRVQLTFLWLCINSSEVRHTEMCFKRPVEKPLVWWNLSNVHSESHKFFLTNSSRRHDQSGSELLEAVRAVILQEDTLRRLRGAVICSCSRKNTRGL